MDPIRLGMCIVAGISLITGCLIGFFTCTRFFQKRTMLVTDIYEVPTGRKQTTTQFHNACIVKLTDEIRKTGALHVQELDPGRYKVTLRVVK